MKFIQIYNADGTEYGLFSYTDRDDIGEDISECYRKAEMALQEIIPEDGDEEDFDAIFEDYLYNKDICRILIEEEIFLPK